MWKEHGRVHHHMDMLSILNHVYQAGCFPTQLPGKTIAHLATESRRPFLLPDWVWFLSTFLTDFAQYRLQPSLLSSLLAPTLESHTSLLASLQQAAQLPCTHIMPHPSRWPTSWLEHVAEQY